MKLGELEVLINKEDKQSWDLAHSFEKISQKDGENKCLTQVKITQMYLIYFSFFLYIPKRVANSSKIFQCRLWHF